MAARVDSYTRAVNTVKVILPLCALGLLSTLFFFSGEVDPTETIPYAELNVEELARQTQVTAPYFAGVTEDGVAVTLTGDAFVPDPKSRQRSTVERMDARFETQENLSLSALAPRAVIDTDEGIVTMTGGACIETSDGMKAATDGLIAEIDTANIHTLGPITAEAPFGQLSAEKMTAIRPLEGGPHRMVFQGGVKLLYQEGSQ